MFHHRYITLGLLMLILVACTPTPPGPTATPLPTFTPTVTPSPTPTPTPSPTPTPIPPMALTLHWPDVVSVLPPVRIEAVLAPPPNVNVTSIVTATILAPGLAPYATFDLFDQGANQYVSSDFLQLPLEPPPGDWLLVLHVQSTLDITGERVRAFQVVPPAYRVLTDTLPGDITIRVPQDFIEVKAQGNAWAGGYVWRSCDKQAAAPCPEVGDVELWWAPGPAEPLQLDTATVMVEATHPESNPPTLTASETTDWQERPAFLFYERWPGYRGGPAEAWVIRGDDGWLYVLRAQAIGEAHIPTLVREVVETFGFTTD